MITFKSNPNRVLALPSGPFRSSKEMVPLLVDATALVNMDEVSKLLAKFQLCLILINKLRGKIV